MVGEQHLINRATGVCGKETIKLEKKMIEKDFTGVDLDDALNNASTELKITADNIDFEVVSLGSKGFLGLIGKKPAVIKVNKN